MNRITVDKVKEAYEATGIQPITKVFVKAKENCACAISTLLVHNAGYTLDELCDMAREGREQKAAQEVLGINCYYYTGFLIGFDGGKLFTPKDATEEQMQMRLGYLDGLEVREALEL